MSNRKAGEYRNCIQCQKRFWLKRCRALNGEGQYCSVPCYRTHRAYKRKMNFAAIFWGHVDKGDRNECWLWTGGLSNWGYGRIGLRGNREAAHRVAWHLSRGEIPEGLLVCHKCDIPGCVNPDHLFLGTVQDNHADMVAKMRMPHGENHYAARLTRINVTEILKRLSAGEQGIVLAAEYGVSNSVIYSIKGGHTWKSVPR